VIVQNRLGAGGAIAAKYVASAEPDGHLISVYTSAFTIAPLLNQTFDPGPMPWRQHRDDPHNPAGRKSSLIWSRRAKAQTRSWRPPGSARR
jgi:hypothetical protein